MAAIPSQNTVGGISSVRPGANDRYSPDYQGSYDEWVARAARDMAARYARGDQSMLDNLSGATGPIGQPNRADFGTNQASEATYDFFARYVATYSGSDPYIAQSYGAAPGRRATYGSDPNSASALDKANREFAAGESAKDREFSRGENAADRAAQLSIAASNNATDLQIAGMQTGAQIQIASMQDATDRYIAQGNWGVQKYVAELQEKGALDRLKLELGMRDKELAQRAKEEQSRHHEAMIGLVLEVAKYDAELASEPRNWLAYASWLGNRDIVINGLSLAMAADMVPADAAAMEAANSPFPVGQVAAAQEIAVSQQGLADGSSGGSTAPPGADIMSMMAQAGQSQVAAQGGAAPYTVAGANLESTNYGDLARQLLGMQPGEATRVPTTAELQAAYDSTSTTGRRPGFGEWTGNVTTRQGVEVNPSGHLENYTNFKNLLPTQQEMRLGAVQQVRGKWGVNDFLAEMERARPKGTVSGAAGLG